MAKKKNPKPWIHPWLEGACICKNVTYYENNSSPSPENNVNILSEKISETLN